MITLRDYVNWGIAHSDNVAKAEGVPLVMENCKLNERMIQLEVYGADGGVGECISNWFDKNLYLKKENYTVSTDYPSYSVAYIEGLKPNTKYNVVIERLNGTKLYSYDFTTVISGGTFSVHKNEFTAISHWSSSEEEVNGSPHTSDEKGRLTIGVSATVSQTQLDMLWANTNVYLYEYDNEKDVYKIPVVIKRKNVFKPTVVSASSIRTSEDASAKGSYGTVIDSTDFSDNKVVVTQTANEAYGTAAYQNGYICFEIPELVIGRKYVLSFDLKITDNPLNATSLSMWALNTSLGPVSIDTSTRCRITFTYKTPATGRKPDVELRCGGASFELSNVMITEAGCDDAFEPYTEPVTTNVFLNEPLRKIDENADVLDFRAKKVKRCIQNGDGELSVGAVTYEDVDCDLPTLTAKTSVIDIDTSVKPSKIKGKYIKR